MRARLNGVEIDYTIDGDTGPWLVMSHSLGCTQAMWDLQMPALTARYRVLRYDSRGHAQSEGPPGAYTLEQLADDAAALLDHVGVERAVWVGFSMGGMIGQVFALRHAARVRALVLADTTSEHHATPQSVWDERIRVAHERGHGAPGSAGHRSLVHTGLPRRPSRRRCPGRRDHCRHLGEWVGGGAAPPSRRYTPRLTSVPSPVPPW